MSTSGFYEAVSPGTQPSYFDLESGLLSDVQTCPSSRVHTRPSSKGDTTKPGVDLQPEFGVQDEPIFHNFVWPPSTLHQPLPDNQLSLEPRKKRDTEGPDALLTKYIGLLEERATELHSDLKYKRRKAARVYRRGCRDRRRIRRDVDQVEENFEQVWAWVSCVNNVLCPIIDERLRNGIVAEEENGAIQSFFDMMEDGPFCNAEESDGN